jgi:hypothetical protein
VLIQLEMDNKSKDDFKKKPIDQFKKLIFDNESLTYL